MDRVISFHSHYDGGRLTIGPAFYADTDYEKVAVRVYAGKAPTSTPARFDIYDDGVSIFNERGFNRAHITTGVISTDGAGTYQILNVGETSDETIEDFTRDTIEKGSWVTCEVTEESAGKHFTIQLELRSADEEVTDFG